MNCCESCNCPLTVLQNARGKTEKRTLCARCLEDAAIDAQVESLHELAKENIPMAKTTGAKVLRIDQYLAEKTTKRAKRGRILM